MMKGNPINILTTSLAARLNPLLLMPLRANELPDAPATRALLGTKCAPIKLRVCWPPGVSVCAGGGVPGKLCGGGGLWEGGG